MKITLFLRLYKLPFWVFGMVVFMYPNRVPAQPFTLLKTIAVKKITAVSADRYGNFLLADASGNVTQYDSTGKKITVFSPQQPWQVSFIEAWRTVKIFVFYREAQKFTFLNRFLVPEGEYDFPETGNATQPPVGFARLATLANDDNLWVYDDTDFSLKKYNPDTRKLLLSTQLNLLFDSPDFRFNFIREYENLVFLNDFQAGIRVFDNLGNYKKLLPFKNLNYLGFLNDNLYFFQQNELHFFNLYTFEEKKITLPTVSGKTEFVLVFEKRLLILTQKEVFLYSRN